ncbi:MAG: WD40-repeat-containing domain protein [Benniella sp.]|nr:MAG: WD40-repeat-containing domain protein [Benniella sp.]
MCDVAFSPHGNQIASASGDKAVSCICELDKTARLWNVITGEPCGTLDGHTDRFASVGHTDWVRDVAFSPGGDRLASASEDCTMRLWSVATGECCLGDVLAPGSWDKTVRLWDVASGRCKAVIPNFPRPLSGVAWIPSTDDLAIGCDDGSVLKWQVIEEEEQCRLLKQRGVEGVPENMNRETSNADHHGTRGITDVIALGWNGKQFTYLMERCPHKDLHVPQILARWNTAGALGVDSHSQPEPNDEK